MRSKLRKFGFYLILVVFAFVATFFVGELGVTVYHIVRDGKYISPGERLAAERNAYVEAARAQTPSACGYGDSLIAHPYLALRADGSGTLWFRLCQQQEFAR